MDGQRNGGWGAFILALLMGAILLGSMMIRTLL
jgi:hypothetical protein